MSDLDKINSIFNAKIDSIKSKDELQNLKTEFFGKNGQITSQFKNLGSLNPEKKKVNLMLGFKYFLNLWAKDKIFVNGVIPWKDFRNNVKKGLTIK